jgi:hypothetical protein
LGFTAFNHQTRIAPTTTTYKIVNVGEFIMARSGVGRPENTTMQQIPLWIFWAIVGAFIACGRILTRKPTKKPPTETLRPAMPDEHQPSCFGLEEERGGSWKGSGGTVPPIKEAKPSL